MKRYNTGDKIMVYWSDAVIYGKESVSFSDKLVPVQSITEGKLINETDGFVIVGSPHSSVYDNVHKKYISETSKHKEEITFFYIPKGMIEKIRK